MSFYSLVLEGVFAELDTLKEDQLTVVDLSIQAVKKTPLDLRKACAAHNLSGRHFAGHKDVAVVTSMWVLIWVWESAIVG